MLQSHTLNNVPLFAEEVKFFPEESIFANSYLLLNVCHTSFGNRLRDKILHNCVPFRLVRKLLELFIWIPNNFVYIVLGGGGEAGAGASLATF